MEMSKAGHQEPVAAPKPPRTHMKAETDDQNEAFEETLRQR